MGRPEALNNKNHLQNVDTRTHEQLKTTDTHKREQLTTIQRIMTMIAIITKGTAHFNLGMQQYFSSWGQRPFWILWRWFKRIGWTLHGIIQVAISDWRIRDLPHALEDLKNIISFSADPDNSNIRPTQPTMLQRNPTSISINHIMAPDASKT